MISDGIKLAIEKGGYERYYKWQLNILKPAQIQNIVLDPLFWRATW